MQLNSPVPARQVMVLMIWLPLGRLGAILDRMLDLILRDHRIIGSTLAIEARGDRRPIRAGVFQGRPLLIAI